VAFKTVTGETVAIAPPNELPGVIGFPAEPAVTTLLPKRHRSMMLPLLFPVM
jgi:hypothetical protein